MAKKIDMSKLSLGTAKPIIKKTATTGDAAVEKIHQQVSPPTSRPTTVAKEPVATKVKSTAIAPTPKKEEKKKPTKKRVDKKELTRITVDVVKPLHKRIKIRALNQEITIRDYIIGLIEADLKKK